MTLPTSLVSEACYLCVSSPLSNQEPEMLTSGFWFNQIILKLQAFDARVLFLNFPLKMFQLLDFITVFRTVMEL